MGTENGPDAAGCNCVLVLRDVNVPNIAVVLCDQNANPLSDIAVPFALENSQTPGVLD